MIRITGVFLAIAALLTVLYVGMNREHQALDDAARQLAAGNFVELRHGMVHYERMGAEEAPVVLLVHGFATPSFIWDPTVGPLSAAGYQVIRFDLYGRGFTDRPDVSYDLDLYVEQIRELLEALAIKEPIHLVGLSMGGPVVTRFTNRYPPSVGTVTLIDPLVVTPERFEMRLLTLPWIGEYLSRVMLVPMFEKQSRERGVADPSRFPNWFEKFEPQTRYPGYTRALLRSVRYLYGRSFEEDYRQLGRSGKPVHLFWGTEDQMTPFAHSRIVADAIPVLRFDAIEGAGHTPHFEEPDRVNPRLIHFLRESTL